MENRIISYAQNREDVILAAFFPELHKGFYVDIGAHHPVEDSVTKLFYEKGWKGINIEPNKRFYKLLCDDRPRDINVNRGIADKKGELNFREYPDGDGLSTFSTEMQNAYEIEPTSVTSDYIDSKIPVITLKDLFQEYLPEHIHFLKIDIEGFEYHALIGNDWANYKPEVICIEANHIVDDWRPLLASHGYKLVFNDGLNEYYAASEERAAKFSYVEKAISKDVIYYKDFEKILELEKLEKKLNFLEEKQAAREHELLREIVHRDTIISESRRTRNALIIFLHSLDNVIKTQIGRFNHPIRKNASNNIEIVESIEDKSSSELISIVAKNDLQNFYSKSKGSGNFKKPYLYLTLWFLYAKSKKILRFMLKLAIKPLRVLLRQRRNKHAQ